MKTDLIEVSTPKLIELLSRPNGLRPHNLLFLQDETINPAGERTDISIVEVGSKPGEFLFSMPEKGHRRVGSLDLGILADAGWFPSPQLAELIRHFESAASSLDHIDLAEVQARIEREREAAKRHRDSEAHSRLCDSALKSALDALAKPEGKVADWHLVLLAMTKHSDQLIFRGDKEAQFLEDQVAAARAHGPALRSSPKQLVWQNDILRRSADNLRKTLGA